ncbi:hypothetical protein GCK72_022400 [Caenorhabditis remanei]|uniref:Uncharacterized protein n=1 Tax=Caenorhabditis remanei TaxID=31234 RepID=A0A6A5FTP9_CAERE|nr:hypothetical protein GCK72_022400 [Caenorhabditis remanei]KAF1745952.1 hypothetical protein GCK72_022400 [Caenorhabditis remanei]
MQSASYSFPILFNFIIVSKFEVFLIQKSNRLPPIHGIRITSATITAGITIIGVAVNFALDWQRSVQTQAEMKKSKEIIAENSNITFGLTKQQDYHTEASEEDLKPATVFKGLDPLMINVCSDCRAFNAKRETQEVSPGMVQLPLALCLICRAHFVRSRKFYEYDVVLIKKKLEDQRIVACFFFHILILQNKFHIVKSVIFKSKNKF